MNNHSLPLEHTQIIITLEELHSCSYWWLHNNTSHKIFSHASEKIRFITGHQVQFGATCHESISNIQHCINSLSLITKVATGEWLFWKPHKAEGLSVCEYRSDGEGGNWWDIAVYLTLFSVSQCRVPQGLWHKTISLDFIKQSACHLV